MEIHSRRRRTVAIDRDGRSFGDPELIRLAEASGGLPPTGVAQPDDAWSIWSRAAALTGMLILLLFGFKSR